MGRRLLWSLVPLAALLCALLPIAPARAVAPSPKTVDAPRMGVLSQADACDPEQDLAGSLSAATGEVTNRSATCAYLVGIASYRVFDDNISHQQIFAWETAQIEPGQTVALSVDLPDCVTQVDLFYGPVQFSLAEARYGERLLNANTLHEGRADCQASAPSCVLYAADVQRNRTQLLALDPRDERIYELGEAHDDMPVRGLALHPRSGALYAMAGAHDDRPTQLYRVDRQSGVLTLVGATGVEKLGGLAFRASDATLWAWAQGTGLVEISVDTGAATPAFSATLVTTDLAWSADGARLYVTSGESLRVYTPADGGLTTITEALGFVPRALDLRADGQLLAVDRAGGRFSVASLDPDTGKITSRIVAGARGKRQIEALAWPAGCGSPGTGGVAELITTIDVAPQAVCAGEELQVTVMASHPENPDGQVTITINDHLGSPQFLRFTGRPGLRIVQIVATTAEGHIDSEQRTVEVRACDAPSPYLEVHTGPNRFREHSVDFKIANADAFAGQSVTYRWEFGDGASIITSEPYVAHYYGDQLAADQLTTSFQATVTLQRTGQPDVTARTMVTLWNPYALNRMRGFVQPPISTDARLLPVAGGLRGTYTVRNLEPTPIRLTGSQVEYQPCDPDRDPTPATPASLDLEVGPGTSAELLLELPAAAASPDVCGVAVTLSGAAGTLPVYTSAYFTVRRNPLLTRPVDNQDLRALLNRVVAEGLVGDQRRVTDEDLDRLVQQGKIVLPRPERAVGSPQAAKLVSADAAAMPAQVGEQCLPGDPAPRPGVTCQATGEWTVAPPHIVNARKGDSVLSSVCGLVGGLLRSVTPPMRWSHSGIMTRDYYELRHNTSATDRYEAYAEGVFDGTDGVRGDVIKYGWPGTITQSIDEAFNGEVFLDPESGKRYNIEGFSANAALCDGDLTVIYPTVVKPVPGSDPSVRTRLRAAADVALGTQAHYRFYSYSNAAIAVQDSYDAPVGTGWAVGTDGSVCSSFIWSSMRRAGITLEGEQLEESDVALGAERDLGTVDGLYMYTEEERRRGSEWLYSHVYNLVYEKAGWLGTLLFDAPDDFASQMTNCFANDSCGEDAEDSTAWKNPGVGRAVSPDNILFWDSPAQGGVYGYSEPMVYRAGDYVPLYSWQPSVGVGGVTGQVTYLGQPVTNASVTVESLGLELFTDGAGVFRDDLVPQGRYGIVAGAFVEGRFLQTRGEAVINAGAVTTVNLALQPPPDYFRQVTVQGSIYVVDDETFGDETGTKNVFESRGLSPVNRRETITMSPYCVGDEVRVEMTIDLRLESDNTTVNATGEARLYEGDSCSPDDREDTETFSRVVVADGSEPLTFRLDNSGLGGGDRADFNLQIINGRQATTARGAISPSQGGALTVDDGAVHVSFPGGAVDALTTLDYTRIYNSQHRVPAGQVVVRSFALNAHSSADPIVDSFGEPYSLAVRYSDAELDAYGVSEGSLVLAYWDGTAWVTASHCASCAPDIGNNIINVSLDHFTEFALIGRNSRTVYLPLVLR